MEIDLRHDLEMLHAGFLIIGVVIGSGAVLGSQMIENGERASEDLAAFLENQSGQELEVMQTEKIGEFYRVEVRTPQDQLVTYYTDGEMFTQDIQSFQEVRDRNTALADFSRCLSNSGTIMYGNSTQQSTQQQIQTLGGAGVVQPIYRDVSNTTNLRQAVQLGIQQVPAFYRNQSVVQGTRSLQEVESFTGCSFQAGN
jgi:hypothetical protein